MIDNFVCIPHTLPTKALRNMVRPHVKTLARFMNYRELPDAELYSNPILKQTENFCVNVLKLMRDHDRLPDTPSKKSLPFTPFQDLWNAEFGDEEKNTMNLFQLAIGAIISEVLHPNKLWLNTESMVREMPLPHEEGHNFLFGNEAVRNVCSHDFRKNLAQTYRNLKQFM